jgi:hypothetical protein
MAWFLAGSLGNQLYMDKPMHLRQKINAFLVMKLQNIILLFNIIGVNYIAKHRLKV